jgi:hypothetical protein
MSGITLTVAAAVQSVIQAVAEPQRLSLYRFRPIDCYTKSA